MDATTQLDRYLPEKIRAEIEQRYYARVSAQSCLEALAQDEAFLHDPTRHVAFFADHGVVHVRDIAQQVLTVLERLHGVLIPHRETFRLDWMRGYGVMLTYLHDIGMCDMSPYGRAMHPEFAAQAVFAPDFETVLATLWEENCGNLAWRLLNLASQGLLAVDPRLALRELLAMAMCHSKRKAPMEILNDPQRLRRMMQRSVSTDLHVLHRIQQVEKATDDLGQAQEDRLPQASSGQHRLACRFYRDFQRDAFAWLRSDQPALRLLLSDVMDTLRALRCADALRQRGSLLRTSASYQIFVDQRTANAIHAFHTASGDQMFLLETPDAISAGEANLASCELTREGDVRLSFNRGAFASPAAVQHAARAAAVVITDIQADVVGSFTPSPVYARGESGAVKTAAHMRLLVEETEDNPDFANLVCSEVIRLNPHLSGRCGPAPALQHLSARERNWYVQGAALDWNLEQRRSLLRNMAQTGQQVDHIDPARAFQEVKQIDLMAGEVLLEAGAPSGFVYIPLGPGLIGAPLGGYQPFSIPPWALLGATGVVSGAPRNATVAAQRPLRVLMIPKTIFLHEWHRAYTLEEFRRQLAQLRPSQIASEPMRHALSAHEGGMLLPTEDASRCNVFS